MDTRSALGIYFGVLSQINSLKDGIEYILDFIDWYETSCIRYLLIKENHQEATDYHEEQNTTFKLIITL